MLLNCHQPDHDENLSLCLCTQEKAMTVPASVESLSQEEVSL